MKQYVEYNKMTKKQQREYNRKQRVMSRFNTGTRVMNTDKYPSRARQKDLAKRVDNWN